MSMNSFDRAQYIADAYCGEHIETPWQTQCPRVGRRIAIEYGRAIHAPTDPRTSNCYDAFTHELFCQYQAIRVGHPELEIEFADPITDPYDGKPSRAIQDIIGNDHFYCLPTTGAFGSGKRLPLSSPMLVAAPFTFNGESTCVNDIFRVVHDYFGHAKDGNGFGPHGEEHAWRTHSTMFSPLARRVLTTETRGQNCWVNFGPHAVHNKNAGVADTIYADQKVALLPDWITFGETT